MLLTAAKIIKENENILKGKVRFLFQTDEECQEKRNYTGDQACYKDLALSNVDVAFGMHILSGSLKSNEIGFRIGSLNKSVEDIHITIN